ncbi:hypothetical protein SDRG_07568 [Saprolegnia diclina VS20]|uniref:Uncharacterized protein n=1 Tax=Saprolegnia diclina (strain VS20) TaxID=1156394 RepID=T0RQB5_SAPDV|nr:hypothetical protein SDRG_07568 [Saprolegnia diclina VS20]EQC34758.1 hypothetical protein SDRG_07568 [Saprolegnia diclina VS20]|eukprot:XP_008611630.1 hypothetical protein SDRG_07568 [Saprolegnia diclina VS20]
MECILDGDNVVKWSSPWTLCVGFRLVAWRVLGRDNTQCNQKWTRSLDPDLVLGRWTKAQIETLVRETLKDPNAKWKDIAARVGRPIKQCLDRWDGYSDPTIVSTHDVPFTEFEISWLLRAYGQVDTAWTAITNILNGQIQHDAQTMDLLRSTKPGQANLRRSKGPRSAAPRGSKTVFRCSWYRPNIEKAKRPLIPLQLDHSTTTCTLLQVSR